MAVVYLDCNSTTTPTTPIPPRTTYQERETIENLEKIRFSLLILVPPFLVLLGTGGNICVIFVLRRKCFSHHPASSFFKALSFCDILILWIGLSRYFIIGIANWDIRLQSYTSCWIHTWITYALTTTNNWVLVSITATRLLYLKLNPFRVHQMCKRQTVYFLVVIIAAISMGYYFIVCTLKLERIPEKGKSGRLKFCDMKKLAENNWYPVIHVIVYFYAPASCIVLLNWNIYLLHFKFLKQRKQIRLIAETVSQRNHSSPIINSGENRTIKQVTIEEPITEGPDNERQKSSTISTRPLPPLVTIAGNVNVEENSEDETRNEHPLQSPSKVPKKSGPQVTIHTPLTLSKNNLSQIGNSPTITGSAPDLKSPQGKAEQPIAGLLLLACLVFILLNAPWSIFHMINHLYLGVNLSPVGRVTLKMAKEMVTILMFTNNAINFLVYVAFGERFRSEFKKGCLKNLESVNIYYVDTPTAKKCRKPH